MKIFVVKQIQPSAHYDGEPIALFDSYDKAVEQCKKLNKEYLQGVEISDDYYNFEIKEDCCYDNIHAYIVDCLELNKEIPFLDDVDDTDKRVCERWCNND